MNDHEQKQLDEFFEGAGREWGARPDVMLRVAFGINQAVETVREHCDPQGPIQIEATAAVATEEESP